MEAYWYIACRSKDLKPNRPLSVKILNRPMVLFRDGLGNPCALEDRCSHRNVPLSKGKVERGAIRCPYHGWKFGCDGRACEIPALRPEQGPPDHTRVPAFRCIEQDSYIWVLPTANMETPPMQEKPMRFPYLGEKGWTAFHMKTRFRASVDSCLENFLDCPHATYVHAYWFRAPTYRPMRAVVKNLPDGVVAEYFEEPREKSLVWWLLSKNASTMKHTDRYIAPSTTRVDYIFSDQRHYTITSSCTPITDTETEVYTVINFKFRPIGPLIRLFFEPLSRRIIKQDVDMLDLQQENISKFGKPSYRFIEPDLLGPGILKWRQAVRNHLPSPGLTLGEASEKQVDFRL